MEDMCSATELQYSNRREEPVWRFQETKCFILTAGPGGPGGPSFPFNPTGPWKQQNGREKKKGHLPIGKPDYTERCFQNDSVNETLLTMGPGSPLSPGNPLRPGGPSFPGRPVGPGSPYSNRITGQNSRKNHGHSNVIRLYFLTTISILKNIYSPVFKPESTQQVMI